MTYKSSDTTLSELAQLGLKRFVPMLDQDDSMVREIWMPPAIHDWLFQGDRKKTANYKGNIRAFLRRFIIGSRIDNCEFMKNWTDDVWELRVQLAPYRENTRIFGAFVERDHFVAFYHKLRSDFDGADDPRWKIATDKVVERWTDWFGARPRVRSVPFAMCVSDKFSDDRAANGGVCL